MTEEAKKEEIKPYATFMGVMKRIQPRLLTIEVQDGGWITLLLKPKTYSWILKAIEEDEAAFRRSLIFLIDEKGYVIGIKVRKRQ